MEQRQEISDYISTAVKYRETYYELYDHIINALNDSDEVYCLNHVAIIINRDFGGFKNIQLTETNYQKQLNKKYISYFRSEMLSSFSYPGILNNAMIFALCIIIYFGKKNQPFNLGSMLVAIQLSLSIICLFGFYKIVANRLKFLRYSILDNFLGYLCSFGLVLINSFLSVFISKDGLFDISVDSKLILALTLFFFGSLYARTFIKIYNQKLNVLAI
ncbi:hypothetical protein [Pedobacter jejuensis]|nr:hypothetical protein [Pedobacter jejuensis]